MRRDAITLRSALRRACAGTVDSVGNRLPRSAAEVGWIPETEAQRRGSPPGESSRVTRPRGFRGEGINHPQPSSGWAAWTH